MTPTSTPGIPGNANPQAVLLWAGIQVSIPEKTFSS
jgi:hypothetical protein